MIFNFLNSQKVACLFHFIRAFYKSIVSSFFLSHDGWATKRYAEYRARRMPIAESTTTSYNNMEDDIIIHIGIKTRGSAARASVSQSQRGVAKMKQT
jgi:hypothetical protein